MSNQQNNAEAEAKAKAEAEAKAKAEAEAKAEAKAEADAKAKAEAEAKKNNRGKAVKQIEILSPCAVLGMPVDEGDVLDVPADISEADAKILVRMGRAEWMEK